MNRPWIGPVLLAGLALATAGTLSAQQRQPGQTTTPAFEHDPDLDSNDQLSPSQIRQPMPDAVAMPTGGPKPSHTVHATDAAVEPGAMDKQRRRDKRYVVACSGVFAKDSDHSKLAMAFHARNVTFGEVASASGTEVTASVLFAKDPKRRLEVWWSKPATHSDTHLIVINGESDWVAPGELHLGLTLADLEQLNGKPFKLLGFDKNNVATLNDWNKGQLSALPGGCRIGVSLHADPATSTAALKALPADQVFASNDSALRATNPTVSEILVAY